MIPLDLPVARLFVLQPVDALDPIATFDGDEEPTYRAVLDAFKRAGLADYLVGTEHAAKTPRRDARGRFVARGQG